MTAATRLTATGWYAHRPGGTLPGGTAGGPLPPPGRAAELLGRKGLLGKEPATRLALCAVHRALGRPDGARQAPPVDPWTAVVACSNLGSVDAVAGVVRTVAAEGGRAVSVLQAPNVSANVIAGSVALWFRFGGPALMVCSGPAAGLDGLRLAGLLLRAGRAHRVVLVGVEHAGPVATALHALDGPARPLRTAAACVLLERHRPDHPSAGTVLLHLSREDTTWPAAPSTTVRRHGADRTDPHPGSAGAAQLVDWGDCSGADGVLGLAVAAALAAAGEPVAVRGEGTAVLVTAVRAAARVAG